MPGLSDVFQHLDKWRLLPGYQLERRADIFFSLYLPRVLEEKVSEIKPVVVPEFPVRKTDSNRSVKIDYIAVTADRRELLLIELKTDPRSIRKEQIEYLIRAANLGPAELLDGLRQVSAASKFTEKYSRLWNELQRLDLHETDSSEIPPKCRIVLIQPAAGVKPWVKEMMAAAKVAFDIVSFADFAEVVGAFDDPLSRRFAESLCSWGE